MLRKKQSINPVRILEKARVRQAYASGQNAGRRGAGLNPWPHGSAEYTAWANGYSKGMGNRRHQ